MDEIDDPLWSHFKPLWLEFAKSGEGILVAGGYGLFLKQKWMLGGGTPQSVVPLQRWPITAPRATGDMDLIVALDLIADERANKHLFSTLKAQGFEVSREKHGKRWKFFKQLNEDQHVIAELHARPPDDTLSADHLKANRFAVKHKPSLGDEGVHGRTNREAVGSELHAFNFELEGVSISVPNPVSWTVMKLTAGQDNRKRSLEDNVEPDQRQYFRNQAVKHVNDACRAIAMMTVEERDSSNEVLESINGTAAFSIASKAYLNLFTGGDAWANEVLRGQWLPDDLELIQEILNSWYAA